nr:putative ribonuclease H-like domain-containing protein [Tanacetum cinerariifolium]
DITYYDDEDVVGALADFNNLESSIPEHQALKDPSWIEAMQEELLQFKMQKVRVLVDLPHEKRAIGTKWVYRNKKDERGIVIRNEARLVAQGHTQEEGIDYEEVFDQVARIKAIRLFLAYASFMNFMMYQMDIKSAFLYGSIMEEVYVFQPPGFEDPDHPDKVYKVVKTLYGLHQAPRACSNEVNVIGSIVPTIGQNSLNNTNTFSVAELEDITYYDDEDVVGKLEGKVDEGFLVGYPVNSKAFKVFNSRTRIVQETLHVNFLENKPNVAGSGPTWLFDIDSLTRTMNYHPINVGNQTNPSTGFQDKFDAKKGGEEVDQQDVLFLVWSSGSTNPQNNDEDAAFDGKEHNFDVKKPESEVIL